MMRRSDGEPITHAVTHPLKVAPPDFAASTGLLACQDEDPDLWFSEVYADILQAKRLCLACPFMNACLSYALAADERWGVWGAKSAEERRQMKGLPPADPKQRTCPRCDGLVLPPRHIYDTEECRKAARRENQNASQDRRRLTRPDRTRHAAIQTTRVAS
jgi:hypothetical protein